jgi:NAD(P)-dependent dehydrogenase (short-subunit alcohol dehydrogenase family)
MKILVIGANGNIGQRVVAEATARRHDVTAAMRDPGKGSVHESHAWSDLQGSCAPYYNQPGNPCLREPGDQDLRCAGEDPLDHQPMGRPHSCFPSHRRRACG